MFPGIMFTQKSKILACFLIFEATPKTETDKWWTLIVLFNNIWSEIVARLHYNQHANQQTWQVRTFSLQAVMYLGNVFDPTNFTV